MNRTSIMAILLITSGLEIFFNIFSNIIKKLSKNYKKDSKGNTIFKLIWVALFLITSIYFLFILIEVFAGWFGVPLDKNIFEIFK